MAAAGAEKLAPNGQHNNATNNNNHVDNNNNSAQPQRQSRGRPATAAPPPLDPALLEQHISEIVVLPSPDLLRDPAEPGLEGAGGRGSVDSSGTATAGGANDGAVDAALRDFAAALRSKIVECQQIVAQTSVVSLAANLIESRILANELGSRLAKLYELLGVNRMDEFERSLDAIAGAASDGAAGCSTTVADVRLALDEWERFLVGVERQLDQVVGPEKAPDLDSTDDIHLVSHNKMFRSGTLLSYLKKSAYEMIFLEIVTSFLSPDCYQHVKMMFESLGEFQKNNCDILLLTKRPTQGGGGFLKLIGIPFRILLNEKESLKQLLAHRRSVVALAGVNALHCYAEFASNEHAFEVDQAFGGGAQRRAIVAGLVERASSVDSVDSSAGATSLRSAEARQLLGSESGCALVNRRGHILYSHVCQTNDDWPDVDELLQHVKKHQSRKGEPAAADASAAAATTLNAAGDVAAAAPPHKDDDNGNGNGMAATVAAADVPPGGGTVTVATGTVTAGKGDANADGSVTVYRRKCCGIL